MKAPSLELGCFFLELFTFIFNLFRLISEEKTDEREPNSSNSGYKVNSDLIFQLPFLELVAAPFEKFDNL